MNYFYDVLINMNEDNVFCFYEWENYDPIELIKKIPLYRVSTQTLKDFYMFDIQVTQEFLNSILDKTILKNNKINKTLKYACLLCDTKNSIVVEFNEDGTIISRSNLLLDDEANVLEFIYSYKENKIEYQKKDLLVLNKLLRQEELVRKVINLEFNTMIENNDIAKLKYLFNEWFRNEEDNIIEIKKKIKKELSKDISSKTKEIYDLIMLSYNNS